MQIQVMKPEPIVGERIPFLDLWASHAPLEEQLVAVFRDALRTSHFIGGQAVETFEREFAQFCDVDHCVGVGNGTDALRFALMAIGAGHGDVVVTVPNTFIATTEAISQVGAQIRFVDVDHKTLSMDPARLRDYLETQCVFDTTRLTTTEFASGLTVRAIVPVHLYGQMADMDALIELADEYHLAVVEDACQAHGAQYFSQKTKKWHMAGSMGDVAAFSFYPGKNLGAFGEAGAVTTNSAQIAADVRMIREHGQSRKYYHDREGYNGRLDAIQAGILSVKLAQLPRWNEMRRRNAAVYSELLANAEGVVLPVEPLWARSVYHLYVIRVADRDGLKQFLQERGIETALHYPLPLHLQKAYASHPNHAGDFPVTELAANQILSLPMYPDLSGEQQERVARDVSFFLAGW